MLNKSVLLLALAFLLVPLPALAFGPVAHVDMALELLSSAGLIGGAVASLISRYRRDFILGTLDPDRTLAKNLAKYEAHSHNWDTALTEYRTAPTDAERARSLGRICHLAADTVAHNYFVPTKIVDSVDSPTAGHFFWELRFDARLREIRGQEVLESLRFNSREDIEYMSGIIRPTLATRNFNARLTGFTMNIQKAAPYKGATRMVDRRSTLAFTDDEMMDIRDLALQAQIAALNDVDAATAPVFGLDPRGISCISESRKIRGELKKRRDDGGEIMVGAQLKHHAFFRNLVTSRLPS